MAGSKKRKRVFSAVNTHSPIIVRNSDISFPVNRRSTKTSRGKGSKHDAPESFSFLCLPRPIRDEILALCLLSPDTIVTDGAYPHPPHLLSYDDDMCAPLDLCCPGRRSFCLLTISKQVQEEAAFNMFTRSRFHALVATTHCANLINPARMENNTLQMAMRYLRMMKRIVLAIAIEAFCCRLPRYEYARVKTAMQRFAEVLSRPDKRLLHLDVRYTEFESEHTRASHRDSRQRPDHEWTRSQVMDLLRVEFDNYHTGLSTIARPDTTS